MNNKSKIIFIGPEPIHAAFAQMGQYDFQEPITSLEEFKYEMRLDERESKISRNSSAIIFFSRLYRGSEREFAKLVAFYAPYAVVAILMPEQDKIIMPRMESSIRAAKIENEIATVGQYNSATPTYFISYEYPMPDLTQAMADFVADDEVLERLYGGSDEIVIPKSDDRNGRIIATISSKGGSGKESRRLKVCIVDFNTRDGIIKAPYIINKDDFGKESRRLKVCVVDFNIRDGIIKAPYIINYVDRNVSNLDQPFKYGPNVEESVEEIEEEVETEIEVDQENQEESEIEETTDEGEN